MNETETAMTVAQPRENALDPREETRALERKADAIRREVDLLIAEADKRRHHVLSRNFHLHPLITVSAGLAMGAAVAGVAYWLGKRYQGRHSLRWRLSELGQAAARLVKRPERIGRQDPSLSAKLVAAFGTAAVGALARRSVSGLVPEKKRGTLVEVEKPR